MKRSGLLILSLGLNLLLAGTIAWAIHRRQTASSHDLAAPPAERTASISAATSNSSEGPEISTNEVTAAFNWRMVESTDYPAYVENLRAIGCPEQRIRDIIIADVDDLFAQRARDYIAPLQAQFWQFAAQPRDIEKNFKEHGKVLEQMNDERERIFQMLFNESNPRRGWRNARREQTRNSTRNAQLDYLDETKRAAVLRLQDELNSALSEVRRMPLTGSHEEIRTQRSAKEAEARQASEARLRGLLTAEEFAEYKLRNSTGAQVRHQLARMTLSEAEARGIAQIVASQPEAGGESQPQDATTKAAKEQLEQRTQEQIKQLLGETRYAEYQRVTDHRYDQTARLVERLQLPEQTAVALHEARLEAEKLAQRLRADASASAAERAAALNLIRIETENSVRQLVGDSTFKDYQQHAGWLEALAHPAK